MKVSLSPAAEELVRKSMACGQAASPDEAVERALAIANHLDEQMAAMFDSMTEQELADLDRAARAGLDAIEAGRVVDFDELMTSLRARVLAKSETVVR